MSFRKFVQNQNPTAEKKLIFFVQSMVVGGVVVLGELLLLLVLYCVITHWKMDEKISSLEQRVEAVERGQGLSRDAELALRSYQSQTVAKLIQVRDLLLSPDNTDASQVSKERDAALEENAKLKKDIEKLNYRVNHLVRSLEAEEMKH
jgi:hypothetical protein